MSCTYTESYNLQLYVNSVKLNKHAVIRRSFPIVCQEKLGRIAVNDMPKFNIMKSNFVESV